MKKLISITLCLVMIMALASSAFALSIGGNLGGFGGIELTTTAKKPTAKVQAFMDAVDAIGTVTTESGPLIDAAQAAYDELRNGSMWLLIEEEYAEFWQPALDTLNAAKRAYAALTATEAPTEAPTQAPTQAPTKPGIQIPTEAPTQAPTQAPTDTPVDEAGDSTFMVIAMVVLSMTALVVLVSKKKAF